RRNDPDEVKIQVEDSPDGVTICARYPHSWWGGLNDCNDFGNTNSDVQVQFILRVPTGVKLSLNTVNGSIEARDLGGAVGAGSVNGSIRISTPDRADAKTVNGSIEAHMRPPATGRMVFASVNGNIDLELPADAQADLSGFTVNGAIHSDFPVTTHGG